MQGKRRVSATVDADLIAAAEAAAKRGEVATVSAWVNDAMRLKLEHDRRLVALAAFVADVEKEFGEITTQDMEGAAREMRRRATRVRGSRAAEPRRRYGR
jgi:hypothetical protein